MENGMHDEMPLPLYPIQVKSRAANIKNNSFSRLSVEKFSRWHGERMAVSSTRQSHLSDLVAETAYLKRMLADLYPDLVQRQGIES